MGNAHGAIDAGPVDPPGPDGLPIIGSTREFVRDRLGFLTRTAREYGDVAHMRFAGREDAYLLAHPDHVRHVLVENNQNYIKGHFFQDRLAILGNGLLNSEGAEWRRQRHLIEPAFHPDRIASYADLMPAYTERMIDSWDDGETRNIHADMMDLTLEIIAKALFDVDIREHEGEIAEALGTVMAHFRLATGRLVSIPNWVPTPGNLRYLRAERALDTIVEDIITDRRQNGSTDIVSMLLQATDEQGRSMTTGEIHDQVMTLLLAGHETTAQALTFTWYLLSRHPRVEEDVRAELDDVLGGRPPTIADIEELVVTDRVIRESMRLYPPVYAIVREPVTDDVIDGYRIGAGSTVQLVPWVVHRDPRFYDDPHAFRPARWTDDFREQLHPFAYFPFSGGPRRCIGDRFALLEARLIVATLIQRVHLAATADDIELAPAITLRPKDGLEMRIHHR